MRDMPDSPERLRHDSPFAYQCHRCRRCCSRYMIQVNPYEIIHIAAHFGISTSEVLARYVQPDRPWLKRGEDGACVFLTEQGCGIHPHRPGVCRIYPLGGRYDEDQQPYYFRMTLPEGSAGEFGASGTVADFLESQGCAPYSEASLRCNQLRNHILEFMERGGEGAGPEGFGDNPMEWLDADRVCALAGKSIQGVDVAARFGLYEAALVEWLSV